jgi:hypothetical protein
MQDSCSPLLAQGHATVPSTSAPVAVSCLFLQVKTPNMLESPGWLRLRLCLQRRYPPVLQEHELGSKWVVGSSVLYFIGSYLARSHASAADSLAVCGSQQPTPLQAVKTRSRLSPLDTYNRPLRVLNRLLASLVFGRKPPLPAPRRICLPLAWITERFDSPANRVKSGLARRTAAWTGRSEGVSRLRGHIVGLYAPFPCGEITSVLCGSGTDGEKRAYERRTD